MTPLALTISRFRSFTTEQRFVFPREPGLYFMTGDNRAEPRLEGNGAGKSSVWEALVWCLYGKTSRGLAAGNAANWEDGKGCRVAFEFEVDEPAFMQYTLERTWSPNSWTLTNAFGDVQDLTQTGLRDVLPLAYESFLHCVLMPQGEPLFLDLKPEPKAALFSEVMQLDHWLQYSKNAAAAVADAEAILTVLREGLAKIDGQLDALDLERAQQDSAAWRSNQDRRLAAIVDDIERVQRQHREAKQHVAALPAKTWESEVRSAQAQVKELTAELRAALALGEQAREAYDAAEKISSHCPTCKQLVRADVHDQLLGMLGRGMEEAAERVRKMREVLADAQDDLDVCIDRRDSYMRLVASADQAQTRLEALARELDALDRRAAEVEAERDPYAQQIRDMQSRRAELERQRYHSQLGIKNGEQALELRSAWVRWFKDIRLEQIGSALTELEIETNSAVNAQGLVNWELHFQTDDLRKDGRVSRGFQVFVQSPHNAKPVPWESWSGGESQRLRIAAQQGLADLIRSRMAVDLPLEVWDEPTQWLSPQGVVDLLDELRARAAREQRQIWIVDHRSLAYGGFDGEAQVIKDADGTRVETLYR